jgi:hypothetical protein
MPEEFTVALFDDARRRGDLRFEGRRRTTPDARDQRARGAAPGDRRLRTPGEPVVLEAQVTPEAVFWAVDAARNAKAGADIPALADR